MENDALDALRRAEEEGIEPRGPAARMPDEEPGSRSDVVGDEDESMHEVNDPGDASPAARTGEPQGGWSDTQ